MVEFGWKKSGGHPLEGGPDFWNRLMPVMRTDPYERFIVNDSAYLSERKRSAERSGGREVFGNAVF